MIIDIVVLNFVKEEPRLGGDVGHVSMKTLHELFDTDNSFS